MRGRYFLRTEWSDRHVDHWQRSHQCADPNPPTTAPTADPSTGEAP